MKMLSRIAALVILVLPLPAAAMQIDRVVSPGGIEAWLVQDHSIPAVAMEFGFRGGAALEPAGQEGLANLLASMLVEGAGDLDSQTFQGRLEDQSISLGFDSGLDTIQGSLKTLTENLDSAASLLHLALTQPRMDVADLARVKTRIITGLRRAAEEPRSIAGETWMATAFPGEPYGRPSRGTPDSVAALTAEDLRAFLAKRLGRDNLVIGVSGDITPEALAPLLDRVFGDLPAHAAPWAMSEVAPAAKGQTIVIRRAVPQSVVMFGEAGVKRDDPDFYAATLMNYILGGGGFNSRLTNEVREKRGLAYSVYSYLAPYDHTGLLLGGTASENSRVAQSIQVIRDVWTKLRDEGPSADELAYAKTYITGSFPLQLDSTGRIARLLVSLQYDHLGIDYVERRQKLINDVTIDDVKRVGKRLLDPARLIVVVVGEPTGLAADQPPADRSKDAAPAAVAPAERGKAPAKTGNGN